MKDNEWNVIYTYPKREKKIYNELEKKSIQVFLPFQKVIRQWSDRKKKLEVPLFPNYIFVNVPRHERYKVLSVAGITRFISFNGKPATISEREIEAIKTLLNNDEFNVSKEGFFRIGDRVKITQGPLKGLSGTLFEKRGVRRFALRFASIEQVLSFEIQPSHLEKIGEN